MMPAHHRTILGPILAHADAHPQKPLYTFHSVGGRRREVHSYESFLRRTGDIALHLLAEGVCEPGDRVLLVYPPGIELLCAFFACVRLGVVPVPVCPPASHGFAASLERMSFIAEDCGATAVLTDRAYSWSVKLHRARVRLTSGARIRDRTADLRWVVTTGARSGTAEEPPGACSETLFLQYTSGSTRDPRGVVVTHRNVLANCAAVFDHAPIGVSWLPQYHDMGLIGACLFVAIAGGTTHLFSPLDFLRSPSSWLRAISRFRATTSVAPSFAYALCLRDDKVGDEDLVGVDLGSLKLLMNGAEPVRPDVFEQFRDRFVRHGLRAEALCAAYGLAEHTLAVANGGSRFCSLEAARLAEHRVVPTNGSRTKDDVVRLVSCGRPVGSTEVKIVDVSGPPTEAIDGHVGEIWVDGPSKCLGYWNRSDLTEETFRARLSSGADRTARWLRTGDLGFLSDGELFVCGRLKDLVIVRGLNYYPHDIEALVEEDAAIRNGATAAFAVDGDGGEALVVVAELDAARARPRTEDINARLLRRLGIAADSFTFIEKRTIPKTTSGKIRRHAVRRLWLERRLAVVSHVECGAPGGESPSRVGPGVRGAGTWGTSDGLDHTFHARGLTGREHITLVDAGIDSLALAELASEVERHLEAAGADDLTGGIDLRWLQRIPVAELRELLHAVIEAAPRAKLRFRRALTRLRTEQRELEREMMRSDAALTIPGLPPTEAIVRARPGGAGVLLTGGTGFFGPYLLRSLLEYLDGPLHVLVRATDEGHAWSRLEQAIASLTPRQRTPRVERWRERVLPVRGDLERPNLGLSTRDWEHLAEEIGVVYHNAALVNYLLEYVALRPVNVMGTSDVLRLATSRRLKTVNYVSTTFVFGWSTSETLYEEDSDTDLSLLDFGYSQSKWVAEQLVLGAIRKGLPARVFRPALIAPSLCGGGTSFDIAMRLLAFMQKHAIGTTARNQVSFAPADLVGDNIVAISSLDDTLGETFHVTRDTPSTMSDITRLMARHTGSCFTQYSLQDFVPEVVERCTKDDLLFPLLNFLVRSVDEISAMEFKRYDNRNYRRARARSPIAKEDPPLEEVVVGILRFMTRHGLIDGMREPAVEKAGR